MGIKHRADSDFCKFRFLSKLPLRGQVRSPEMPYVSYPRPLSTMKVKQKRETMKKIKIASFFIISILTLSCNENKNTRQETIELKDEYAIVYNVLVNDSTDNYDVFQMNFDGSDKKNITNLPGVEWTYFSN
jgi:hypothetical protein